MKVLIEMSDLMLVVDYDERLPLFVVYRFNEDRWELVCSWELETMVAETRYRQLMKASPHLTCWWLLSVWALLPGVVLSAPMDDRSLHEKVRVGLMNTPSRSFAYPSFSFHSKEVRDDG